MKQVKIKTYYKTDDGLYEVYLGNGTGHQFNSKKNCLNFLAETNRFLNSVIFSLNQCLSELYLHNRELWMVNNGNYEFDRKAARFIENVEHLLNNAVKRSPMRNGCYYSFIDLNKSCNMLKNCIKQMQQLKVVATTDTIRRNKLQSLFLEIHRQQNALTDYGQTDAFAFMSVERFEDDSEPALELRIAN